MSQELLGLTIHIAPEIGLKSAANVVKHIFWENAQINEQFEELILNATHRIIHKQLASTMLLLTEDDIRVEVVAQYDEWAIEEWFAVGIELLLPSSEPVWSQQAITSQQIADALCQELQARIMMLLIGEASEHQFMVEVEITNYAGMWS